MATFEFDWKTNPDQCKIYGKCWLPNPNKPIKAMVCLVHGFAEHINRYQYVAEFLNKNGFGLISYDQRGHGKSEGKRGDTPSYEASLENIRELLALASKEFENIPLFLYGHSMGGGMVANYILEKKPEYLKGVIITSPWLRLAFNPPAIKMWLAKMIVKIYPLYSEKSDLDVSGLSTDPAVGIAYKNDSLVHQKITARLLLGVVKAGEDCLKKAKEFHLPLLLMHGTADPITSYKASADFASKVNPEKITFISWENLRHELHNEVKKDEILQKITDWLEKQL